MRFRRDKGRSSDELNREAIERDKAVRSEPEPEVYVRPVEPAVCLRHGWAPEPPFPGAPRPPVGQCPECVAEHDARNVSRGQTVYIDGTPQKEPTFTEARAWDKRLSEQEVQGEAVPGGELEKAAVSYMDGKRSADLVGRERRVAYRSPFDPSRVVYAKRTPRRRAGASWSAIRNRVVQDVVNPEAALLRKSFAERALTGDS